MSKKNHRQYVEQHLAGIRSERAHGATLDDVPELIAAYQSPDEDVRADALKRSCPCHVSWEVYEQLRKPALRLRRDPNPRVRALADHLEADARELWGMEAALERYDEREVDLGSAPKLPGMRSRRAPRPR